MILVIASIGSEGLLGTDVLQSCLPHQIDLQTWQLWTNGQSTLLLYQQRQAVRVSAYTEGSLVVPPDSEIVAPISIRFPAGIPPGRCSMTEPDSTITESYGVLVGRTLRQDAFEALKSCLLQAPILGFPTEANLFVLDTDASLLAVGGVLNQIHGDREVVIAYASWGLRQSQRRYCTTRQEILAAGMMCTHFRSCLRSARFTLRTDHRSLQWLQKFCNSDGMLVRWYMLLCQFSVTFEYRPGSQHANADGFSRQ